MRSSGRCLLTLTICAVLSGCYTTDENAPDDDTGADATGNRVGTGSLEALLDQLTLVNDNLLPASLDVDSTEQQPVQGSLRSAIETDNPCDGYDLFGCQPVLLRRYLMMTRMFVASVVVSMMAQVLDCIAQHEGEFADGASGSVAMGNLTVAFSRTSLSVYTLLVKNGNTPVFFVRAEGPTSTIQADLGRLFQDGPGGKMQLAFRFEDLHNWSADVLVVGMDCRAEDVQAPRNISLTMDRAGALWRGKAIIYNPVWADPNPSCETVETDATSMNLYTDFVGDHVAAKANVYFMQRDKTDLSDISDFGMNNFCEHYPSVFGSNVCLDGGEEALRSRYPNPFCNPSATDVAVWGAPCSDLSASVAAAAFGPASDWTVPSAFHRLAITLPASL